MFSKRSRMKNFHSDKGEKIPLSGKGDTFLRGSFLPLRPFPYLIKTTISLSGKVDTFLRGSFLPLRPFPYLIKTTISLSGKVDTSLRGSFLPLRPFPYRTEAKRHPRNRGYRPPFRPTRRPDTGNSRSPPKRARPFRITMRSSPLPSLRSRNLDFISVFKNI